jgi:hypothetical protein
MNDTAWALINWICVATVIIGVASAAIAIYSNRDEDRWH